MKLGPLSDRQRLVIWGTLCLAMLPILYPMPAHYAWDGEGWNRTSYYARAEKRTFLWDYDWFGSTRPDMRRIATEAVVVLLMGMGLAFCLKDKAARRTDAPNPGVRETIPESSPERQVGLWILDDALEMLKQSSFWSAASLEEKLVITASEDSEKRYETPEHIALEILQWFKFRYFEVWQATGAKGSPFDTIDLTGPGASEQMERVTCWLTIKGIESVLGELARPFGDGAKFIVSLPEKPEQP